MGLGLKKAAASLMSSVDQSSISFRSLLIDSNIGFPPGYLPEYRIVDGLLYIRTSGRGRDVDNKPVFYKWLIINNNDLSATADSDAEYAFLPENDCSIMRVMQRSLLPYHENFLIDYYEDVNAVKVITIKDESKAEYTNKLSGAYRTFRMGDMGVPTELKTEIYSYPEAFFKQYIYPVIPTDLLYSERGHQSNHMSSYGGFDNGVTLDINPSVIDTPYRPQRRQSNTPSFNNENAGMIQGRNIATSTISAAPIPSSNPTYQRMMNAQERINQQIASQSAKLSSNRPKTIEETGLRYRVF